MAICSCPSSTAIPTIPQMTCAQNFGQIQKLIFQRIYSSGTTKNSFTSSDILEKASWTALLSAADGTKVTVTPFVEAPTSEGGDAITYGGGNDTLGGVVRTIGRNPVTMTFALNTYLQSIISEMKKLQCEENLGVYLVNGDGQIMAIQDSTTATTHYPIPIRNLFVGDMMPGGLSNPDTNTLSFSFFPNWSDNAVALTPADFNPLTDL